MKPVLLQHVGDGCRCELRVKFENKLSDFLL